MESGHTFLRFFNPSLGGKAPNMVYTAKNKFEHMTFIKEGWVSAKCCGAIIWAD